MWKGGVAEDKVGVRAGSVTSAELWARRRLFNGCHAQLGTTMTAFHAPCSSYFQQYCNNELDLNHSMANGLSR